MGAAGGATQPAIVTDDAQLGKVASMTGALLLSQFAARDISLCQVEMQCISAAVLNWMPVPMNAV